MSKKTLCIFVTSEIPDPYVNVIVHCALYAAIDVKRVVYLNVKGLGVRVSAATVAHNVRTLLSGLSNGQYHFMTGKQQGTIVDLASEYEAERLVEIKELYKNSLDKLDDALDVTETIERDELRDEIMRLRRKHLDCIFDVTAVKKSIIGDIMTVSILDNIDDVPTFDSSRIDFESPWRMLIHDLEPASQNPLYKYVNLMDTPVYKKYIDSLRKDSSQESDFPQQIIFDTTKLSNEMSRRFNNEELALLCNALDIDYNNLQGDTMSSKVLSFIGYFERRDRISDLIDALTRERPSIVWRRMTK